MDQSDIYDIFNMKDALTTLIQTNQNGSLHDCLKSDVDTVLLISNNMAYMSLYRAACMCGNYIAIDILRAHGLNPMKYSFETMSDYECWYGNPVAFALESTDTAMLLKLLNIGFVASCPACMNAGTPETCVILSALRSIYVCEDQFTRILRASDKMSVVSSLTVYIEGLGNDDFPEEGALRFLKSACKSVPQFHTSDIYVTSKNKDFVMSMIQDGILGTDHLLGCVLDTMLGYAYNFFYVNYHENTVSILELENFIHGLITMGASLTQKLNISSTIVMTDFSTRPRLIQIGNIIDFEYTSGTIGEIIGSALENEKTSMETIVDTQMCKEDHMKELFHSIKNIYSHIRFCSRQGLVHRRVSGYSGDDYTLQRMFGLESSIFSQVATFLY